MHQIRLGAYAHVEVHCIGASGSDSDKRQQIRPGDICFLFFMQRHVFADHNHAPKVSASEDCA